MWYTLVLYKFPHVTLGPIESPIKFPTFWTLFRGWDSSDFDHPYRLHEESELGHIGLSGKLYPFFIHSSLSSNETRPDDLYFTYRTTLPFLSFSLQEIFLYRPSIHAIWLSKYISALYLAFDKKRSTAFFSGLEWH